MQKHIREPLRAILSEIVPSVTELNDETCLYHDLLIAGDDAVELLNKINSQFGTRFDNFRFSEYFPDETEAFGLRVARIFGFKNSRKKLSFGHLVKVIQGGRWFDPHESSPEH